MEWLKYSHFFIFYSICCILGKHTPRRFKVFFGALLRESNSLQAKWTGSVRFAQW